MTTSSDSLLTPPELPLDETSDGSVRDHGCLPDWQMGDLPEPLPFTIRNIFRTIGPGAILLAGSIGGGEWTMGSGSCFQRNWEIWTA